MIKKKRQTSVIKRMYAGFMIMVLLVVATVILMLNGTNRIYKQLESVNENTLPLVTFANQTRVNLLTADKIFKNFRNYSAGLNIFGSMPFNNRGLSFLFYHIKYPLAGDKTAAKPKLLNLLKKNLKNTDKFV